MCVCKLTTEAWIVSLTLPVSYAQAISGEKSFANVRYRRLLLHLNMTTTQIKTEIEKVLDSVPETILQDVLDFLKELQDQPTDKVKLSNNLRQILTEDKELLGRLAQ
jgi:hypothetical protein